MQRTINTIKLVCLASKDYQESIVCISQQLGNTPSLIDSKCWLEGQIKDPNSLIILVLPEKNLLVDQNRQGYLGNAKFSLSRYFFSTING